MALICYEKEWRFISQKIITSDRKVSVLVETEIEYSAEYSANTEYSVILNIPPEPNFWLLTSLVLTKTKTKLNHEMLHISHIADKKVKILKDQTCLAKEIMRPRFLSVNFIGLFLTKNEKTFSLEAG